ncbi:MAG: aminotransferase class V-fold PLP-dependent enzyme [Rhizobiaceae bacterium]|nr:aminotransferase class V-fold PLP-dependent enzyme [Rhizobiaceae bacterium]
MLDCQRHLFALPDDVCFFNAAAWSPLPLSAVEAGQDAMTTKSRPWDMVAGADEREFAHAREVAASMIGANSEDIALISSVGYGVATAAKILNLATGSRILTLENDHSSPVLEWLSRPDGNQLVVETIKCGPDGDWTSAVLEWLAGSSSTPPALVSISSIHWSDGGMIDLDRVQTELKKLGTMLLVDATHGVGVIPTDVARLDPDFLIFPTYKWLLGPYGRAFMYIARHHQNATPLEQTSYARKRVVAEDDQHFTDLDYVDGARRFDMGERDFFVSLCVASHSMKLIRQWGPDQIGQRLRMLTNRIEKGLIDREVPVSMMNAAYRSPHILSLDFPQGMPEDFERLLKERRVFAVPRLGRLRISPHVYNNEDDCDRLVEELADILK